MAACSNAAGRSCWCTARAPRARDDSGGTAMEAVDLGEQAAALTEFWSQRIVGEANGSLFKVAKGIGSTNWHQHADQDEVFLVIEGRLVIQLRDGDVTLDAGDMFIVPRGVEHCPKADAEVHLMLVSTSVTSTAAGGKPAWSSTSAGASDE